MLEQASSDRRRLLIYSGSGTVSMDYFVPILPELSRDWTIDFLQGDYAPSASAERWLTGYLEKDVIASMQTAPVQTGKESTWGYHRKMARMVKGLEDRPFDCLLLGTDFYVIDRYLIASARKMKARVVVMHTNLLNPTVLKDFLVSQGQSVNPSAASTQKKGFKKRLSGKARRIVNKVKSRWWAGMNYYVVPALLNGTVFKRKAEDNYTFTSGRGDAVLIYDELEKNAYAKAVPAVKNFTLVRHPARSSFNEKNAAPQKRLLVALSSYGTELSAEKIDFWARSIRRVVELAGLDEVHLRFHPRTQPHLKWPALLKETLRDCPGKVSVAPATGMALIEAVHGYAGLLSAYSGSLRIARAASDKIFVIALLEAGDPAPYEAPWVLGNSEGIHWVGMNDEITKEHVAPPELKDANRLTIAQFLKN